MQADRLKQISPFRVMEVLARAAELESQGHEVVHFEVGEPDFETAQPIVEAGIRALQEGFTKYTPATGITELREAIAGYYQDLGVTIDPAQVVVTSGASGGLTLLAALLLNPGDELLIPDPGYPCNEVFVQLCGAHPRQMPVGPDTGFQPTRDDLVASWNERTKGVLLASPANPTGTIIQPGQLAAIEEYVATQNGMVILDEIYHGIRRDGPLATGLSVSPQLFVLNSFSKYFGMTGWRLGWVVVPPEHVDGITKLCQNLFICPSTPAQYAALAGFGDAAMQIHEHRVDVFNQRCRRLYEGLTKLGLTVPVYPEGAFYLYVDISSTGMDSATFCDRLLNEFYVAVTPGEDFGSHLADKYVRFAFTTSDQAIEHGLERLSNALTAWGVS